jgi:hypothetical protein
MTAKKGVRTGNSRKELPPPKRVLYEDDYQMPFNEPFPIKQKRHQPLMENPTSVMPKPNSAQFDHIISHKQKQTGGYPAVIQKPDTRYNIYKDTKEFEREQREIAREQREIARDAREEAKFKRETARAEKQLKKRQRLNAERVRFARNYFARDYVQNITNWTAAKERPKGYEYTRSGLRMEAVSKGFTDPQSGLLAVDTATQQRKGSLVTSKGSLRIGTGSLISGFNAGVANMKLPINNVTLGLRFGKGDVIMPSQVLKFKKRKI